MKNLSSVLAVSFIVLAVIVCGKTTQNTTTTSTSTVPSAQATQTGLKKNHPAFLIVK